MGLLVANIIEEGRWGGPQKRISLVARVLRDLAVETVVILPERDSSRFQKALSDGGVQFEALRLTRLGRSLKSIVGYLFSFVPDVLRITRCLTQRPYDLVHVSGGVWQIKGALAARWAGIPLIWHLNDTKMPSYVTAVFAFLAPRLANAFFVAADRCRVVYLTSNRLAAFPCALIPAPVDTELQASARYSPDTRIEALRGVKVVSVANINPIKGLDTLIAAANILHQAGHEFSIAIVGPVFEAQAKYFVSLQQQVAQAGLTERIVFLGGVEDAAPCMAAADIYVCSSAAEASPMSVWEAMAASKPVVSTDVGDVSTYVRSGESGYIVPVEDPKALADAISTLISDPTKRREFGERAQKIVEAHLDLLVVTRKTLDGYRSMLASKAAHVSATRSDIGTTNVPHLHKHGRTRTANAAMNAGIDASNIQSGGGLTHLVELLRVANPNSHGFDHVTVWASKVTLNRIEDRPWLVKRHLPVLDTGLIKRAYWQRFHLPKAAKATECHVLLTPGGTFAGVFHPIPVVAMSQNLLPFEWHEMSRYGLSALTLKWILLRRAQSISFQKADGLIFLSQYAKNVVMRISGPLSGKVAVIPHGVDERFVCVPRLPRSIDICSTKNPLRLLYVSNIDAYKHQWNVAEAVAELRTTGMPISIDLVGAAYGPSLEKLNAVLEKVDPAREFIRYMGVIAHDELHHLYHSADLGVFASSCENMPNILLEGMAAGLPIACSMRGPMPEILGDAGVYFDPEKSKSIRQALEKLIASPLLRAEKAQSAFDRAQIYSWRKCADETFEFLAKVAAVGP